MTLLTVRSFGEQSTTTTQPYGWSATGTGYTTGRFAGSQCVRTGGAAIQMSFACPTNNDDDEVIIGMALKVGTGAQVNAIHFQDGAAAPMLTLRANADITGTRLLSLSRGGNTNLNTVSGTLVDTSTSGIQNDVWAYVEMRVAYLAGNLMNCQVRVDGVQVLNAVNIPGGPAVRKVPIVSFVASLTPSMFIGDVYVLGEWGTKNTTYLGDTEVKFHALSGDGMTSNMNGSDGNKVNNYLLVDEVPANTSDYVGHATSGTKDHYAVANHVDTADKVIYGVMPIGAAFKSDSGAASLRLIMRENGEAFDHASATKVLSTTLTGLSLGPIEEMASGAVPTAAWVDGLQIGVEVQ